MSRLIFRNLPPGLTPDAFKSQLAAPALAASVTDTKLVPKRRFAFVGYKTPEDALRVKEYFDGSFVFGGGKVTVELVRDESKTKDTARTPKANSEAGPLKPTEVTEKDKRLQEFMDVMKGTASGAVDEVEGAVPGEAGWTVDGLPTGKHAQASSRKGKERSVELPDVEGDEDDAAWLRKRKTTLGEAAAPDPEEALVLSTGRLFVRNLAFGATPEDLRERFGAHGHVEEVHMPLSKSGDPLGTAFVQFRHPPEALAAWQALDKTIFQGRLLHVLPGRGRPGQDSGGPSSVNGQVLGKTRDGHKEVQGKVEAKRKEASGKGVNWASMYMNSDAVVSSIASRMGISKSELLAGDETNAGVQLALAETTVIAETKQYFEDAGIVISSLSPKVPRSGTIILIKNIPFGTTIHSLTDLFAPHGTIKRILLPPAGTLGVVEYENTHDAAQAFKALSYRRLGNAVLYLEKGPVGMFKTSAAPAPTPAQALAEKVALANAEGPSNAEEEAAPGATLFLKNLAWATTTPQLVSVLSALPDFSFARVQTKPDPKRPGEKLSMGYGFVGFKSKEAAVKAMGGLSGFEIDGHKIEVKFANRGAEEDKAEEKGKGKEAKGTKVLVKNLPFETTKKDVKELFSAYGQLKSLRVPRKPTLTSGGANAARGFAFLEFTTHKEAVRAMEALKHTHLLGRHLVMEWAKEGDAVDVDALREKVGRDRADGGERKRRKLDLAGDKVDELDGLE